MGLGDIIELITTYTGIKWLVKKTSKAFGIEDCGCERRKDKLNQMKIDRWQYLTRKIKKIG